MLLLFFQLEVYKTNYEVTILNFKTNYKSVRLKQITQNRLIRWFLLATEV